MIKPALFHCFRFHLDELVTQPEPDRWDDEARRAFFERWKQPVLVAAAGAKLQAKGRYKNEDMDKHLESLDYTSTATIAMPSQAEQVAMVQEEDGQESRPADH